MKHARTRCDVCGGDIVQLTGTCIEAPQEPDVLDDLAAAVWVQGYDAAWLGQNWIALEQLFAPDVVMMLAGSNNAVAGRSAVVAHLRETMDGTVVHEYNATDLKGHASGPTGVITYRWQLDWTVGGERQATSGRDILVLRAVQEGWQLVWRAQVRARSFRDHRRVRAATRRSGVSRITGMDLP